MPEPMVDLRPLPKGGVRALLSQLEEGNEPFSPKETLTGRLTLVMRPDSDDSPTAALWLRSGMVYAASLSSFVPAEARRLRSAGCLGDDEFEALSGMPAQDIARYAQDSLGVSGSLIDELHRETLLSTTTHLFDWTEAHWAIERGPSTDAFTTSPMEVALLISAVEERIGQWSAVARNFPHAIQPAGVPKAGPGWAAKAGGEVTPELASLLMQVNGKRSIGQIAAACGFTRFEITRLLAAAISDQILVFAGQGDADRKDTDLGESLAAEEARARGPVSKSQLQAAEDAVVEARLALKAAEANLVALREAAQQA